MTHAACNTCAFNQDYAARLSEAGPCRGNQPVPQKNAGTYGFWPMMWRNDGRGKFAIAFAAA